MNVFRTSRSPPKNKLFKPETSVSGLYNCINVGFWWSSPTSKNLIVWWGLTENLGSHVLPGSSYPDPIFRHINRIKHIFVVLIKNYNNVTWKHSNQINSTKSNAYFCLVWFLMLTYPWIEIQGNRSRFIDTQEYFNYF